MNNVAKKYGDIINLPRPTGHAKKPLSIDARAAQFSPYAALVGYKDIIANQENSTTNQTNVDIITEFNTDYESNLDIDSFTDS